MYKEEIKKIENEIDIKKTFVKILKCLDRLEGITFEELEATSLRQKKITICGISIYKYRVLRFKDSRSITTVNSSVHFSDTHFLECKETEEGRNEILNKFKSQMKGRLLQAKSYFYIFDLV